MPSLGGELRPHVAAGDRDHGLVVIGVHTAEFTFEHEIDLVRQATKERGIDHPVVVDDDNDIWSTFDNHHVPPLYIVDTDDGHPRRALRRRPIEQAERVIQRLLGVGRALVSVEGLGVEPEADRAHLRTPEAYLGGWRSERFAARHGGRRERHLYHLVREHDAVPARMLEITFLAPDVEGAYVLTFG